MVLPGLAPTAFDQNNLWDDNANVLGWINTPRSLFTKEALRTMGVAAVIYLETLRDESLSKVI